MNGSLCSFGYRFARWRARHVWFDEFLYYVFGVGE